MAFTLSNELVILSNGAAYTSLNFTGLSGFTPPGTKGDIVIVPEVGASFEWSLEYNRVSALHSLKQ